LEKTEGEEELEGTTKPPSMSPTVRAAPFQMGTGIQLRTRAHRPGLGWCTLLGICFRMSCILCCPDNSEVATAVATDWLAVAAPWAEIRKSLRAPRLLERSQSNLAQPACSSIPMVNTCAQSRGTNPRRPNTAAEQRMDAALTCRRLLQTTKCQCVHCNALRVPLVEVDRCPEEGGVADAAEKEDPVAELATVASSEGGTPQCSCRW
jgi:hypothetical protein